MRLWRLWLVSWMVLLIGCGDDDSDPVAGAGGTSGGGNGASGGAGAAAGGTAGSGADVGVEAALSENPRSGNNRFVNFRPADGEVVALNPPRMSWRYAPHDWEGGDHTFTFQIADADTFQSPVVDVVTPFNFYNTLPALNGAGPWYWRVGYDVGTTEEAWSEVRSFTVAADAIEWDRSALANPDLAGQGHPRILFNATNLAAIRALMTSNTASQAAAADMKADADAILQKDWWQSFPQNDTSLASEPFYVIARDLVTVAFVWKIYDDATYAGVKDRAVTYASYPMGGYSSPEGAGGDSNEDSTQATEFLALLFDWLHPQLNAGERQSFVDSLEWRVDHIINDFAWKRDGTVRSSSLSTQCFSHAFESSMDTAPACLAIYEHSAVGKECFDLMLNYLIGVTNGFGFDEGWNEGPGYGNSKMKWLMNASIYFDTALPGANLGQNPYYRSIGDFFARITPVGLPHSPWGNGSANDGYYVGGRRSNYRRLAFLTGEGRFLRNWRESGGNEYASFRPWIEYVLPHHYAEPTESLETDMAAVYPIDGWVTAGSHPPSAQASFDEGVGVIFQSRSRGGYSHSFNSDNSFQLHAYGQQLNHGGGGTVNQDAYAYHTMSHTTVLVDGLGQAQPASGPPLFPTYARVAAFKRGDEYVYFAGDATRAYPREPGDFTRWGFPLDPIYEQQALGHLLRFVRHVLFMRDRYFVVFDDLETDAASPAQFTWLYHILPDQSLSFSPDDFTIEYAVEDVAVKLVHVAYPDGLELDDRQSLTEMQNPFTGEDYRAYQLDGPECAHNLWITNREPASKFHFLTVIYPYRQTEPEPIIRRIDDVTVEIESEPGLVDRLYFGADRPADATLAIDYEGIAASCCSAAL